MRNVFAKTKDVSAATHKAFETYTHVIVSRSYRILNPVYFKSELIADLPIFIYANWDKGTVGSRDKWQEKGGVLIDRSSLAKETGPRDALILVECPLSMEQLRDTQDGTELQIAIYEPPSWTTHEYAVETLNPKAETIQKARAALYEVPERAPMAAVTRLPDSLIVMTDNELSKAHNVTLKEAAILRRRLKAVEVWSVKARLVPTQPTLLAAWEALTKIKPVNGVRIFTALDLPHWKRPLKEMARFGHVTLSRYYVYPTAEPNYAKIQKQHDAAVSDLAAVKEFMKGLTYY